MIYYIYKMAAEEQKSLKVAVVGGGLVGCLAASFFAKHGHQVDLYELREDIREMKHVPGRSINMALSFRGLEALDAVGLKDAVQKHATPMHARLIHNIDGSTKAIPYGKQGQFINSISRRLLNEILLTAAEETRNVNCFFSHKLTEARIEKGSLTFKYNNNNVSYSADLVVGCDGAYSVVRRQMLKKPMFNYSQTYIPHGYMELVMPADSDSNFAMEENYLHIWPRGQFMMIALPNQDGSFTCTLFMPFQLFDTLNSKAAILEFYNTHFPDSISLFGEEKIVTTILATKPSPLLTVKCNPYHIDDKCVILGDAAHAMVPFFGQGMNCGFEDCLVLDELLGQYNWNLKSAFSAYSEYRNPDAEAICDLALYNYIEMRDLVNSRLFLLRKFVDNLLNALFPNLWSPLYTMVTFSRTRYHVARNNRRWQNKIIKRVVSLLPVTGGILLLSAAIFHQEFLREIIQHLLLKFPPVFI